MDTREYMRRPLRLRNQNLHGILDLSFRQLRLLCCYKVSRGTSGLNHDSAGQLPAISCDCSTMSSLPAKACVTRARSPGSLKAPCRNVAGFRLPEVFVVPGAARKGC